MYVHNVERKSESELHVKSESIKYKGKRVKRNLRGRCRRNEGTVKD